MYQRGMLNSIMIIAGLVIVAVLIGIFSSSSRSQTERQTTTATTEYRN